MNLATRLRLQSFVPAGPSGVVAKTGSFAAPTTNGNTSTVDLSTAGFSATQPLRAVKFDVIGLTAAGASAGNIAYCQGIATKDGGSVQQFCKYGIAVDGGAASDAARGVSTTTVLRGFSAATPTVDYSATFDMTNTGFTITWTDAPATAILVRYTALGGSDITAARVGSFTLTSASTNTDVTVATGWGQPNLAFVLGGSAIVSAAADTAGHDHPALAAFDDAGNNRAFMCVLGDASGTIRFRTIQTAKAIVGMGDTAAPTATSFEGTIAAKASWPTDGFRITFPANPGFSQLNGYLALKGPFSKAIGAANSLTSVANTDLALGVTPAAGFFWGGNQASSTALIQSGTGLGTLWFGSTDGTTQGNVGGGVLDAASASTWQGRWVSTTRAISEYFPAASAAPTLQGDATAAPSGTNMRVSWVDADTAAREYNYVLIGPAP